MIGEACSVVPAEAIKSKAVLTSASKVKARENTVQEQCEVSSAKQKDSGISFSQQKFVSTVQEGQCEGLSAVQKGSTVQGGHCEGSSAKQKDSGISFSPTKAKAAAHLEDETISFSLGQAEGCRGLLSPRLFKNAVLNCRKHGIELDTNPMLQSGATKSSKNTGKRTRNCKVQRTRRS